MRESNNNRIVFAGTVTRTTERAVLFKSSGMANHLGTRNDEIWVPRSVLRDGDCVSAGDTDIDVAEWWLDKQSA